MVVADNAYERLALKWFDRLSAGDFGSLKKMLHADATWTIKVTGIQGVGHGFATHSDSLCSQDVNTSRLEHKARSDARLGV
jgi:hypothetical protein